MEKRRMSVFEADRQNFKKETAKWERRIKEILQRGRIPAEYISELRHMNPVLAYPADAITIAIISAIKSLHECDTDGWIILMRLINSAKFYRDDIKSALGVTRQLSFYK